MYCPDCGTQNNDATRFCSRCGANLEAVRTATLAPAVATFESPIGPKHVTLILVLVFFITLGGLGITLGGLSGLASILFGNIDPPALTMLLLVLGFSSVVGLTLIVRSLLKMIPTARSGAAPVSAVPPRFATPARMPEPPAAALPPPQRSVEGYQSVAEHTTARLKVYEPPHREEPRERS